MRPIGHSLILSLVTLHNPINSSACALLLLILKDSPPKVKFLLFDKIKLEIYKLFFNYLDSSSAS